MRAFTGIWMTGMISQMLQTKMKLNSVSRNGVQPQPSGPIVCRMMPFADEVDDRLGHVLHAGRHELLAPAGDEEERRTRAMTDSPHQQDDLVDRERACP